MAMPLLRNGTGRSIQTSAQESVKQLWVPKPAIEAVAKFVQVT